MLRPYREVIERFELIQHMVRGQMRANVRNMTLGSLWYLLSPTAQIAVYYFLVAVIFNRQDIGGVHAIFVIILGIVHYKILSETLSQAGAAIYGGTSLLLQVRLEPLVLVATNFYRGVRTVFIGLVLFAVVYSFSTPAITPLLFLYPLVLGAWLLLCWLAAVVVSTLTVFARDLTRLTPIFLQLLMYAAPVVYPLSFVPQHLWPMYFLNPAATVFGTLQWIFFPHVFQAPPAYAFLYFMLELTALFILAHVVYGRSRLIITRTL